MRYVSIRFVSKDISFFAHSNLSNVQTINLDFADPALPIECAIMQHVRSKWALIALESIGQNIGFWQWWLHIIENV